MYLFSVSISYRVLINNHVIFLSVYSKIDLLQNHIYVIPYPYLWYNLRMNTMFLKM